VEWWGTVCQGRVESGFHTLGYVTGCPFWLTLWSSYTTYRYHPKESELAYYRDICISMFVTIAKLCSQPRFPSTDKQIKKMWYISNGVWFSYKEEQNYVTWRKMDGTGIILLK
jgi:hypothetical protein